MSCLFHKWNGCKCEKCGKIRDHSHKIIIKDCVETCSICGNTFQERHEFPETNECSLKCKNCDLMLDNHEWDKFKCTKCGKIMTVGDVFTSTALQFLSEKAKEISNINNDDNIKKTMELLSKSIKNENQVIDKDYFEHILSFKNLYEDFLLKNPALNKRYVSEKEHWDNEGNSYYVKNTFYSLSNKDILSITMNTINDIWNNNYDNENKSNCT
jgi:hypothetical protein